MAIGTRGSWRPWEHQVASTIASAGDQARLLLARTDCLHQALAQSEGLAVREILREFHDLELEEVIGGIVAILRECLLVMVATTGGGALIGGLAGGIGGAGVGALPGAALGATAGVQLGEWILAFMGLKAIATYIVRDMPKIVRIYWLGIQDAWRAARPASLPRQAVHEDHAAIRRAAQTLARGHVAMFVLLLIGIVAYLSKGRGSVGELAQSVRASKLGPGFARWLARNAEKLKAEPRLLPRRTSRPAEPVDPGAAPAKAPTRPRSAPKPSGNAKPGAGTTGNRAPASAAPKLEDFEVSGLRPKAIHYGNNGKVAVIGRTMGSASRPGVRDYGAGLSGAGYKTELFDGANIPSQALDEFQQLASQAKQDFAAGLRTDEYLTTEEVKKTLLYKENVRWAEKLKAQDYTVVDLGNPYNLGSSAFYDAETAILFPGK